MFKKLQIDRSQAPFELIESTWRRHANSPQGRRLNAWRGLYLRFDEGATRQDYARSFQISPRTLNRWIHQFNQGGFWTSYASRRKPKGRKPAVDRAEFRKVTLPSLKSQLGRHSAPVNATTLYRYAKEKGLFGQSFSTFWRLVRYEITSPHVSGIQKAALKCCEYLHTGQDGNSYAALRGQASNAEARALKQQKRRVNKLVKLQVAKVTAQASDASSTMYTGKTPAGHAQRKPCTDDNQENLVDYYQNLAA